MLYFTYMKDITAKEAGRMGAEITNKKLTKEIRSKAAKKGWRKIKREKNEGIR